MAAPGKGFGPEHEGKELERLEQDRTRQKVRCPPFSLILMASIGKVWFLFFPDGNCEHVANRVRMGTLSF